MARCKAMAGIAGVALALVAIPDATAASPFATRHAEFTPGDWHALDGWNEESHAAALAVFRQNCARLRTRDAWQAVCARSLQAASDEAAARAFFEDAFVPYQAKDRATGGEGLLTGYFEPILEGSRNRQGAFVVPVHGVPADLLYLDLRQWRAADRDADRLRAIVRDRQVLPAEAAAGTHAIDPAVFDSEPLDRRLRVRAEGSRIVPYWSRQQIEAGIASGIDVLAWVDDPQALYLMQVQGSGRIRLRGGEVLRVGYGDQNGHPFRPKGVAMPASRTPVGTRTRNVPGEAVTDGPDAVASPSVALSARTRGLVEVPAAAPNGTASRSAAREPADTEADRIVAALLAGPAGQAGSSRVPGRPSAPDGAARPAAFATTGLPYDAVDAPAADPERVRRNLAALAAARSNDPSYVFFQPAAAAQGAGPVGALGVALTAGRSLAVDPRSTPLGAPVFVVTRRADGDPIRRLMFAQDTGGAIRGAVRADFFWGTGPQAGAQAMRTRDELSMWVLLPKGFSPPSAIRTRAVGSGAPASASECLIADPLYCVD